MNNLQHNTDSDCVPWPCSSSHLSSGHASLHGYLSPALLLLCRFGQTEGGDGQLGPQQPWLYLQAEAEQLLTKHLHSVRKKKQPYFISEGLLWAGTQNLAFSWLQVLLGLHKVKQYQPIANSSLTDLLLVTTAFHCPARISREAKQFWPWGTSQFLSWWDSEPPAVCQWLLPVGLMLSRLVDDEDWFLVQISGANELFWCH